MVLHQCHLCDYNTIIKTNLTRHLSHIHNIDVILYFCDVEGCPYKSKQNSRITAHKENVHDIGNYTCDFCVLKRNSHIPYNDTHGRHHICRNCYNISTGKHSRIEKIWSDYIDTHLGTSNLIANDMSFKSLGSCLNIRPDKLYINFETNICEILECDEHQHATHNGDYTCDEKRISEMYDDPIITGKRMVVIRWNPDKYTLSNQPKRARKERLEMMVDTLTELRNNPPKDMIHIYYMFYDENSNRISKEIPHTLIF